MGCFINYQDQYNFGEIITTDNGYLTKYFNQIIVKINFFYSAVILI